MIRYVRLLQRVSKQLKVPEAASTIAVALISELTYGMSDLFITIGELILQIS